MLLKYFQRKRCLCRHDWMALCMTCTSLSKIGRVGSKIRMFNVADCSPPLFNKCNTFCGSNNGLGFPISICTGLWAASRIVSVFKLMGRYLSANFFLPSCQQNLCHSHNGHLVHSLPGLNGIWSYSPDQSNLKENTSPI